jgi:hypothetical protein
MTPHSVEIAQLFACGSGNMAPDCGIAQTLLTELRHRRAGRLHTVESVLLRVVQRLRLQDYRDAWMCCALSRSALFLTVRDSYAVCLRVSLCM